MHDFSFKVIHIELIIMLIYQLRLNYHLLKFLKSIKINYKSIILLNNFFFKNFKFLYSIIKKYNIKYIKISIYFNYNNKTRKLK